MKILAIRGKNMASLSGEFEVEFDQPPLLHAGLFAITGPTGSGKSTLLDTLCLALYDKIPRFDVGHGYKLDRDDAPEKLMSNDVRNILRRGAGEGSAQVDFLGKDGYRYRATWSVSRTRRGKGNLRKQTIAFDNLDKNLAIGSNRKMETLALIQDKLGLDFRQFCRSVLLAQGDFAAFLKADPNERAEVLERMTGTELYSKISIAAYEKSIEADKRLAEMKDGLEHLEIMEDPARKELDERVADGEKQVAASQKERDKFTKIGTWYERESQLLASSEEARTQLESMEETWAAMGSKQKELADVEAVQPIRALPENVDRSFREAEAVRLRLAETEKELEEAVGQKGSAEREHKLVRQKRDAAAAKIKGAKPELDKARELDTRITENDVRLRKTCDQFEKMELAVAEAKNKLETLESKKAGLDRDLKVHRKWFADHDEDDSITRDWSFLKSELERYTDYRKKRIELADELELLAEGFEKAKKSFDEKSESLAQAEQISGDAAKAEQEAKQKSAEHPVDEHRSRLKALDEEIRGLSLYLEWMRGKQECETRVQKLEEQIRDGEERATELAGLKQGNQIRMEEAEEALDRAKAALDLEDRRTLLTPDNPCPLCGSLDHPYVREPVSHKFIEEQEARVRALKTENRTLGDQTAELNARLGQNKASLVEHREKLDGLRGELSAAESVPGDWRAIVPEDSVDLHDHLRKLKDSQKTLGEALRSAEDLDKKVRSAADHAATCQKDAARLRMLAHESEKERERKQTRYQNAKAELSRLEKDVTTARENLHGTLVARDRASLSQSPEDLLADLEARVRSWRERKKTMDACLQEQSSLAEQLSAAREKYGERRDAIKPVLEDLTQCERVRDEFKERRKSLFGGRSVSDAEQELSETLTTAEKELESKRGQLSQLENRIVSSGDRCDHLKKDLAVKEEARFKDRERLDKKLGKIGFDESLLRELLQHDEEWIRTRREEIEKAEKNREHWRSLSQDREKALAQHRQTDTPAIDRDEVGTLLGDVEKNLKSLEEHLADNRVKIKLDDERRRQREARIPLIEKQEFQTVLCQEMSELIGSAKGDKFRRFAQGLTFDALIASANIHLHDLQPRYRLERVPNQDLELRIVDLNMADEFRGINTLSGGESFMVSLALALGLSSLSAERTNIESLFIDEGFGTLDVHSLDVALDTLESLQATGKTIGIISHLTAVADRVGARVEVNPVANAGSRLQITAR